MEVIARLASKSLPEQTDGASLSLMSRDETCTDMQHSIANLLTDFEAAKALFDATASVLASYSTLAVTVEGLGSITTAALTVELTGAVTMGFLAVLAACTAFDTACYGFPPALLAMAKSINGKLEANAGVAALLAIVATDGGKLERLLKPFTAGAGLAYVGFVGAETYANFILDAAINYYKGAEKCCASVTAMGHQL